VEATPSGILFTYRGTDELIRGLEVKMDPAPSVSVEERILRVPVSLKAGEKKQIRIQWIPYEDGNRKTILDDAEAISRLQRSYREWMETCPEAVSDLPSWNELYKTSLLDYRMLMTDAGDGELPVAGVPWYAVPFGRDSLIAAWQALPVRPGLAKSVLRTMARFQGKKLDGWRDEEPGKIMHEIRYGELARTNQVPFTPYYGTIDATPLFLILIGEVYRWTGDLDFVREMADAAGQALDWIDRYGDPDNRGYVSYARRSQKGIDNQGWKDSGNSIVHQDGRLAEAPIALCEVQGYVYLARTIWAHLYALLGDHERSNRLRRQAEELKDRFRRDFWMSDEQFVALALDKDGQQVRTVTSNPGHCLMTGILDREEARMVARRLLSPDMFSGWGIRTMSSRATAYNPMSYHNGSVWPHDNSLILNGLKQLGFHAEAKQVMDGLLAAASRFPQHRLPELFCGYDRTGEAPVPYPVACSPQAWAAGTAFVMLSVMLGIEPDPEKRQISLSPLLPEGMNRLRVRRLCVGEGRLDLSLYKVDGIVHVAVEQNTTGWQIVLPPLSREKKS
jgi:glycogen debranching enzyme